MKLYYAKHTCAVGIHLLLEEIGLPYETRRLDFGRDEQHGAAFEQINPKGKVPVIVRDDGTVLTEFGAIAHWLAAANPAVKLIPATMEARSRADELLDYVVGTLHGQAFARIFSPERFTPSRGDHAAVREAGCEMVNRGFAIVADALTDPPYAAGDFSIADAALFYVENWARQLPKKLPLEIPDKLQRHLERMDARPAVQRALAQGEYNT